MKYGFMGMLFSKMFGKTVYEYTSASPITKLIRTKTLGAGGDCCDFHVVKP